MKQIEYFYNIIYYFFYRAIIKLFIGIDFLLMPIIKIFYFFVNKIPSIRKYYVTKENNDPLDVAIKRTKKVTENPKLGLGTMIGASGPMLITFFLYMSIYHIILYLFFPFFQDNFGYVVTIIAILAFLTDVILCQKDDKGEKYIKEFNKRKGWWRTKWKIITILSLFLSLWFSLTTS
ncbi:hypothetical protein CPH92_09295, partial [Malaciobacter marinus]